MLNRISLFCALLLSVLGVKAVNVHVGNLTVEGLAAPLNVETQHPRLSWIITSDRKDVMQTTYHVLVSSSPENLAADRGDVWDSGVVSSDQSVFVPYDGPKLKSNQRLYWKVKVGTTQGESPWSQDATWGMGLLGETAWGGQWIGWDAPFAWDVEDSHSRMSSRYLRNEFKTEEGKQIKRATAHISGLGLYEFYINGQKVGDQVLNPAPTDYRQRVLYNSFDVTPLLKNSSDNALGITLGNGRYYTMRQNYKPYKISNFGYPKARLNLIVEYTDGTVKRVNTDSKNWKLTARGPIRSNNEYDGEIYDANFDLGDWTLPGYEDSTWLVPQRVALPYGALHGNTAEGMKVMQTLKPKTFRKTDDGRFLIDFGQNTAGWIRINVHDTQKGDTVVIRYSERMTPDSLHLDVENLRNAQSTDRYIANGLEGNGFSWAPKFSYHGGQYAEITGIKNLKPEDVVFEVIYDDMARNGSFSSSNPMLDAIHRNASWGISSNYKGVPVDCPQRDERQPWTGDHNMGTWGENFIFDNANFYAKWMDDMHEAQRQDGCIPDICPPYYNYYTPDMTWSSSFPVICDMLYEQTGDIEPIVKNYDALKKWMNFIRDGYTDGRGLITADKYGDWCVPPEKLEMIHSQDPARKTDGVLIASAYYYKVCQLMAKFARLQGLDAEAKAWEEDGDKVKNAFNKEFLTYKPGTSEVVIPNSLYPDSIFYGNNTVTANLLPLTFGMVPDSLRSEVRDNIIKTIITTNKGHISTGVIGVNWLMRELSRIGRGDIAMLLATNKTYPSWGYMIENGATAIWELWNGDKASRKMNSLNHIMMLGDLINWMYMDLAGFNPEEPGYKKILLKPDFSIPDLFDVDATYKTRYGLLASKWSRHDGKLKWEVTIPCNTIATLVLPTTNEKAIKDKYVKFAGREGANTLWTIPSGTYSIDVKLDPSDGAEDRTGILVDEFLYESASFPEAHASTIVELKNGDLVAAYFGGTKERNPDCVIWVSRKPKGSDKWSEPIIAADGVFDLSDPYLSKAGLSGINAETTPADKGPVGPNFKGDLANARRKACWNPVLFQIPGSDELLLFYKIGSSVGDWTGWMARSTDGGKTWGDREPLPDGILGPIKNKPEYINGRLLSPSSREGDGWHAVIEYSDDQGKTWHSTGYLPTEKAWRTDYLEPCRIADFDPANPKVKEGKKLEDIYSIQPSILKLKDGRLQILCRTRDGKLSTSYSSDNGTTWTPMTLTSVPSNQSGTDAVTLKDGRHVLIYNNFQTIPGTPKGARTPLCIAVSEDGVNWTPVITLEDSPISQYSYPAIIQGKDGKLHAVWTWRRQRIKHAEIDLNKALKK